MKFIVLIFLFSISLCRKESIETSIAVSDAISELFVRENLEFDFILYGKSSKEILSIFEKVAKFNRESLPTKLLKFEKI